MLSFCVRFPAKPGDEFAELNRICSSNGQNHFLNLIPPNPGSFLFTIWKRKLASFKEKVPEQTMAQILTKEQPGDHSETYHWVQKQGTVSISVNTSQFSKGFHISNLLEGQFLIIYIFNSPPVSSIEEILISLLLIHIIWSMSISRGLTPCVTDVTLYF